MSKNKPIAVRNLIAELIESSKQFAFEIQSDDLTLFLQANGEYSELFFKINKHEFSDKDNEQMYFIEYAPQTIHNETPIKYKQDYLGVKICLRNWLDVISQYPNIEKQKNEIQNPKNNPTQSKIKMESKKPSIKTKSKPKRDIEHTKTVNNNFFGDIKNSQINQESDLRESPFIIANDATNAPNANEKKQNAMQVFIDNILKYWFIPVAIGLIILLIEYKSGFFIK